jgi:hypothetical protein
MQTPEQERVPSQGTPFPFNDRSRGIFADGYTDRDGLPVGDTFAYRLRAAIYGAAGRDWPKARLADWIRTLSSAEMDAMIAVPVDHSVAQPPDEDHDQTDSFESPAEAPTPRM